MAPARERFALPLAALVTAALAASACPPPASGPPRTSPAPLATAAASPNMNSFTVSILSRGKGVPREARDALAVVRKLLEEDRARGLAVTWQSTRLGLEGETHLCARYEDPTLAADAYARARALVSGIDLVHLAAEPCAAHPGESTTPKQEE